jgi:putative tRNA adenosine deaminase-associated protein
MSEDTVTDFAVAAYLEDGAWTVAPLRRALASDLAGLLAGVRQLPAESGAIALVSVADEFFLALRVRGDTVAVLVSDAAAAEDWPLGREALDAVDAEVPEDDGDLTPVGDLDIFADLGLSGLELAAICADPDAFPDELLGRVAERLGFGAEFDQAVDGTL